MSSKKTFVVEFKITSDSDVKTSAILSFIFRLNL